MGAVFFQGFGLDLEHRFTIHQIGVGKGVGIGFPGFCGETNCFGILIFYEKENNLIIF